MNKAIKICVVSSKGGTGKTTTVANLGGLLADLGYRVLLVDADVQPSLSSYYDLLEPAAAGLSELVIAADIKCTISRTVHASLDIVLSNDPNGDLRTWILHQVDGRVRLKHILAGIEDRYDFIILDTQGAIGPLQDAAVAAADFLLSPITPDVMATREFLRGTLTMLDHLRPLARFDVTIGKLHGFINKMQRTTDARTVVQALRQEVFVPSRGDIAILDTVVADAVAYREATSQRVPVHLWRPARTVAPEAHPRSTMLALVRELLPHVQTERFLSETH